jgi:hypothetical protein
MYGGGQRYSELFGRSASDEVNRGNNCSCLLLIQNGIVAYLKESCRDGGERLMRPLLCFLDNPIAPSHLHFNGCTLFGRIRAGHKGHCQRFESFLRFRYGHSFLLRLLDVDEHTYTTAVFYVTLTFIRT